MFMGLDWLIWWYVYYGCCMFYFLSEEYIMLVKLGKFLWILFVLFVFVFVFGLGGVWVVIN